MKRSLLPWWRSPFSCCCREGAQAAYAQDIGSGVARPSSSSEPSTSAPARKPPPKPSSNRFENYSTAASLGLSDPDAERIAAIALQKRMEGIAGQWEYVESSSSRSSPQDATTDAVLGKRPADNDDDDTRHFKLRKRNMEIGLGKIYDPGAITIKPKKKEEPVEEATLPVASSSIIVKPEETDGSSSIKWKSTRWNKAGDVMDDARAEQPLASELLKQQQKENAKKKEDEGTKTESEHQSSLKLEETEVKPKLESEAAPPSSMFKKRKPATAGTRGKRTI